MTTNATEGTEALDATALYRARGLSELPDLMRAEALDAVADIADAILTASPYLLRGGVKCPCATPRASRTHPQTT